MTEVNWEWIILIIVAGLIFFAGMGIFIGTRISSDKRRIRELEVELAETRKELEVYRTRVNSHFKKTSELFTEMTNSYRAIYIHLAQGSQDLCTTDAALLKPASEEFLKVAHEEDEAKIEQPPTEKVQKETESPADMTAETPQAKESTGTPEPDESEKAEKKEEEQKISEEHIQKSAGEYPGMKNEKNENQPVPDENQKERKTDVRD